MGDLIGRSTYG